MNAKHKKNGLKGKDPDDLIERALQDRLSENKSEIYDKPIYKALAPIFKPQFAKVISIWAASVSSFTLIFGDVD